MYSYIDNRYNYQYRSVVQFKKLKTKYSVDKDITVTYVVQNRALTSTRDWIGIFPRGWTNLEQYLTFEYVVVSPKNSVLPEQSVIFLHTFHKEASPNIDYQFVYVSKETLILGTSYYFRFAVPLACSSPVRDANAPVHAASKITPQRKSIDECSCRADCSSPQPRAYGFNSNAVSYIKNKTHFLQLHNAQLAARMSRLARDLELAENAVETERLKQTTLSKTLKSYEMFVAIMLKHLNLVGTVKIVAEDASEIIVQKLKTKQLAAMFDQKDDRFVPVLEHPALKNWMRIGRAKENAARCKRTSNNKDPQDQNLCESSKNVEAVLKSLEDDQWDVEQVSNWSNESWPSIRPNCTTQG